MQSYVPAVNPQRQPTALQRRSRNGHPLDQIALQSTAYSAVPGAWERLLYNAVENVGDTKLASRFFFARPFSGSPTRLGWTCRELEGERFLRGYLQTSEVSGTVSLLDWLYYLGVTLSTGQSGRQPSRAEPSLVRRISRWTSHGRPDWTGPDLFVQPAAPDRQNHRIECGFCRGTRAAAGSKQRYGWYWIIDSLIDDEGLRRSCVTPESGQASGSWNWELRMSEGMVLGSWDWWTGDFE